MEDAVDQGLVGLLGISNVSVDQLMPSSVVRG
jgi:diketogulonate reductase-like aldo/keto reductase